MEWFDFFFGLRFGGQLHSHTDNLSKDLQGIKAAAVSGQGLAMANLTKETLTKMPSDQSFDHFYGNISRKSEGLLGKPTLPPVNPATSVAGERSFSSAWHLKTWLLSRMGDLAVLNGHKRRTDSVSITTQEFVFCNKNRRWVPCLSLSAPHISWNFQFFVF